MLNSSWIKSGSVILILCKWTLIEDDINEKDDRYKTGCGYVIYAYCVDIDFIFCPYCGKDLENLWNGRIQG